MTSSPHGAVLWRFSQHSALTSIRTILTEGFAAAGSPHGGRADRREPLDGGGEPDLKRMVFLEAAVSLAAHCTQQALHAFALPDGGSREEAVLKITVALSCRRAASLCTAVQFAAHSPFGSHPHARCPASRLRSATRGAA